MIPTFSRDTWDDVWLGSRIGPFLVLYANYFFLDKPHFWLNPHDRFTVVMQSNKAQRVLYRQKADFYSDAFLFLYFSLVRPHLKHRVQACSPYSGSVSKWPFKWPFVQTVQIVWCGVLNEFFPSTYDKLFNFSTGLLRYYPNLLWHLNVLSFKL